MSCRSMKVNANTWDLPVTIYKGRKLIVGLAISTSGTQIPARIMIGIPTRIETKILTMDHGEGYGEDCIMRSGCGIAW